jgi:hypothetical protein
MKSAVSIGLVACSLTGCFMPHIEQTHPSVHGIVLKNGVPVAGVTVSRCIEGCKQTEQVVSDSNGTFDLPAHRSVRVFVLPIPHDPISDFGFDLKSDDVVYRGSPRQGIGRPPKGYTVTCELAGAIATAAAGPPGSGMTKPACEVLDFTQ